MVVGFTTTCAISAYTTYVELYRGGQFYWWRKLYDPEKTTDLSQVTDKTLLHNVVHLALIEIRIHNISGVGTDCTGSCKSNYHTITTTTAPI
jgi:hypothetical protein